MTTNLNAIAGPSRLPPSPLVEVESPSQSLDSPPRDGHHSGPNSASGREAAVSKPGLSVDENGEVVKVPAFLNKLFSMVSDTSTDPLIYWSDSGDSFFVPNHEQFGKELLPRFFKHSNFSSFVRQLNMYGFHKVPHLQSGVLKNEAPSELWEFVNPFFKRHHPELLSKVTRKNNRVGGNPIPTTTGSTGTRQSARNTSTTSNSNPILTSPGGRPIHLITDGTTEGEAGQLVGPTGQSLDLSAIASNIAAIRQAQTTLTADLQALKASNEHLWREALETREKHRTHEETMQLIISFLERLFGTEGEGLKGLKDALRRAGISGPLKREEGGGEEQGSQKKRKRLGPERMISHGPHDEDAKGQFEEIGNDPFGFPIPRLNRGKSRKDNISGQEEEPWSSSSQRFQSLPTEEDSAQTTRSNPTPVPDQPSPVSDSDPLRATDMNALAPYSYPSQLHSNLFGTGQGNNFNPGQGNGNGPMSPRSTAAAASAFNLDPSILQTTIGSLLQSPAAAQLFLNSLNNSVQGQSLNTPHPVPTNQPSFPFPSSETQQQQPNPQQFLNGSQNQNQTQDALDPTLALFTPLPNHDGLMNHSDNLLKSYQGAAGMNQDVDKLQESIDSLVRSMGLDPNSNANTNTNANPNMGMGMGMAMGQTQPPQQQQQQMAGDNTNGFNSGSGNEFDMNMDMGMDMGMGGETFDNNFDVDQFLTELAKSEKQIQEESKAGQGQGQGQ